MLKIENLTFGINGKIILDKLNLEVKKGTIHSILGANGTGKTTLGYVIMGLTGYKPKEGRVIFEGEDITNLSITERARRGITLAWQYSTPFEGITVKDYLTIAARNSGYDYNTALERVGLDPKKYLGRNYDETLSGGERKRIELAAIITMRPKLAILDEPDSGIDALSMEKIAEVIKSMKDDGTTILLISHNWKIAQIADVSSTLCNGKILITGDPIEVSEFFEKQCEECDHVNKPIIDTLTKIESTEVKNA